jgi:hypothetical protein
MLKVFQFIDSQSAQNTGLIYRPGGEAKSVIMSALKNKRFGFESRQSLNFLDEKVFANTPLQ